ncbi:MAG: hypothetical protein KKA19_01640 [Candidatus Margulisbacteria bacterium]|nr:hypothetical protein [Candidatus Margulisiibacteriota bacterium]
MLNFEEPKPLLQENIFKEEKSTWEKIFGAISKVDFDTIDENSSFEKILAKNLEPNLSLEDLSVCVVQSALEVDFGEKVRYDMDYAKMIGILASALRQNPAMREQMLGVANAILRKKLNLREKTVH